jgi:diaminopimelate decarboxylase/aspartate kinase
VAARWIVLKFGGTSVAGRPQWEAIADLARERRAEGYQVLVVCSAVAGVTNRLVALADRPRRWMRFSTCIEPWGGNSV